MLFQAGPQAVAVAEQDQISFNEAIASGMYM